MPKLVCFGEVLWDLFPSGAKPGGAPMNVAFHAKNLGMDAQVCSAVGDDSLGRELLGMISERGITTELVQTSKYPTGTVTVDVSNPSEVKYTIDSPSAWDDIQPATLELGPEDTLVFGTLACRSEQTKATLFQLLESPAFKVLDINLRAPFYSGEVVKELATHANLIKVNEEEYALMAQWLGLSQVPVNGFMELHEQYCVDYLVVTRGGEGSLLITTHQSYLSRTYNITVADTVGAGDSFLAALIFGLRNGLDTQLTLDYASALGAMVASEHGANPIFTKEDIKAFVASQS